MSAAVRFTPEQLPPRMRSLPVSERGFPIPYFAAEVDGRRDFRVVDPEKMAHAVRNDSCWVCGERLGAFKAFVIGPMCGINRTISDPPSHKDCAVFSARHCPFLSRPLAKRNEQDLPKEHAEAAGFGLKRNPGAVGVWVTKRYRPFRPHAGKSGVLFEMGDPIHVLWYCEGREATRAEIQHSVDTGLPHLRELCDVDGPRAHAELDRRIVRFEALLPVEVA